jgi:hypothetical protein
MLGLLKLRILKILALQIDWNHQNQEIVKEKKISRFKKIHMVFSRCLSTLEYILPWLFAVLREVFNSEGLKSMLEQSYRKTDCVC